LITIISAFFFAVTGFISIAFSSVVFGWFFGIFAFIFLFGSGLWSILDFVVFLVVAVLVIAVFDLVIFIVGFVIVVAIFDFIVFVIAIFDFIVISLLIIVVLLV
jgi:hypothetical protein